MVPVPPPALIAAFRAGETQVVNGRTVPVLEPIASLLDGEGFDAEALRVLAAWSHTDHVWKKPRSPMPDEGRPTPAAWRWLVSGWQPDVSAIALAANVSSATAHAKLEMLIGNRLIFPDGEMSEGARFALKNVVASRFKSSTTKKKKARPEEEAN